MTTPRQNDLTSVADQSEAGRGGPDSILSRQSADHAHLDALTQSYDAEPDVDARGRIVAELGERALRHAFAEETVLLPAYRRHLPGDHDELTSHIEGDHQQVDELLQDLQRADPRSPGYDEDFRRVAVIRHDAHDEEDDLLPRLQQVADAGELRTIGAAWEAARWASPTRPHPKVSRRPPGNVVAGAWLAFSDRGEDGLDVLAPIYTVRRAGCRGATAGVLGTVVMTAGEKVEQGLTCRRNSHVPGRALQRLLDRPEPHDSVGWNLTMHWGTGLLVGVAAGLLGHAGARGVPGRDRCSHGCRPRARDRHAPGAFPAGEVGRSPRRGRTAQGGPRAGHGDRPRPDERPRPASGATLLSRRPTGGSRRRGR